MKKIYPFILIAAVFFYSCKSASKAFEKGNYEDAVGLAVKKLQKDSDDTDAKNVLKDAYNRVVQQREASIRSLSSSNSDNKYERIFFEYRSLQELTETIRRSPEATRVVAPTDYSAYVQTYKEKAGEVYFERGLTYMQKGDKASYRKAYQELKTAYRYKNDNQVKQKLEEAYEGAVVKVLLLTDNNVYNNGFGAGSYYGNNNGMYGSGFNDHNITYQIRNFQEDLVRNLRYQGGSEFVRFMTDWESRSNNIQPDEILEMRLGRLDMGRSYDETNSRDVSKQVVVKQVVYKPDSVVNEYATVSARVHITRRNFISYGDLQITARDASGKYLWSDIIRSEHRFATEFASYTGDQRALSESDRALVNNSHSHGQNQLRREDVFRELLRQLEYEASTRFRNYYSRFY